MNAIDYAMLTATVVSVAGLLDWAWLLWARPYLARNHGWPMPRQDEFIPPVAIMLASGAAGSAVLLIFVYG